MTPPITIFVRTQFTGFHRWKDAPDAVDFLRNFHRHVFHVKLTKAVSHGNRDLEFYLFLKEVNRYIGENFDNKFFESSCEDIATIILNEFHCEQVEVSEDLENGATVTASPFRSSDLSASGPTVALLGVEAEGPHLGATTLFVPATITVSQLRKVEIDNWKWTRNPSVRTKRIYYGGCNSPVFIVGGHCPVDALSDLLFAEKLYGISQNFTCLDIEVGSLDAALGVSSFILSNKAESRNLSLIITNSSWDSLLEWLMRVDRGSRHWDLLSTAFSSVYFKTVIGERITWKLIGTHSTTNPRRDGEEYVTWTRHPYFAMDTKINLK